MTRIQLYQPDLSGNEKSYVLECLETSWISAAGSFVGRFEKAFAAFVGSPYAVATSSGTTALHLALSALRIGPGDEVIVPSFTYIAPVNTIAQTGATPVFVDCDSASWCVDPESVAQHITPRTRAIMAVHLYGGVCNLPALSELAKCYGLHLIEDAAEGIGCAWSKKHVGTWGVLGTFSFYGNKTITTGEGGMVVTSDAALERRLRFLRGQGQSLTRRYWHEELGFNYRMTNVCAAIGLAQVERVPDLLKRKKALAKRYAENLSGALVTFQARPAEVESGEWLVTVLLPDDVDRDGVIHAMEVEGIETRPTFYCAHEMPMYSAPVSLPCATSVAGRGVSLPSHTLLTNADVDRVCSVLRAAVQCNRVVIRRRHYASVAL